MSLHALAPTPPCLIALNDLQHQTESLLSLATAFPTMLNFDIGRNAVVRYSTPSSAIQYVDTTIKLYYC